MRTPEGVLSYWLDGRVVMQRIANPCTAVRFRLEPPPRKETSTMLWLLVVITLNLDVSPPQIEQVEILEILQNEKECNERHKAFFESAPVVPDNFNLGCVLLKQTFS